MMAPETLKELRAMSDEDVAGLYDSLAKRTQVGTEFYQQELTRRATERQTRTITRLTWVIMVLTLAFVALTVVLLKT